MLNEMMKLLKTVRMSLLMTQPPTMLKTTMTVKVTVKAKAMMKKTRMTVKAPAEATKATKE